MSSEELSENEASTEGEIKEDIDTKNDGDMVTDNESKIESKDIDDELDSLTEVELGKALGEEIASDDALAKTNLKEEAEPTKTVAEEESKQSVESEIDKSSEGVELISKISGLDPVALRKLLAGAQVNISITFPKD